MNIFLSWSGRLSNSVAGLLHDWLPNVLQPVDPYFSTENEKGSAWFGEISDSLSDCEFGIICLTRENLASEWIHFEAGAVANRFEMSRTTAFLVDLKPSEVAQPLGQFQATSPTRKDVRRLVGDLNNLLDPEGRLGESRLESAFNKWWSDFSEPFEKLLESHESEQPEVQRTNKEILAEILETSRQNTRMLNKLEGSLNQSSGSRVFAPKMVGGSERGISLLKLPKPSRRTKPKRGGGAF